MSDSTAIGFKQNTKVPQYFIILRPWLGTEHSSSSWYDIFNIRIQGFKKVKELPGSGVGSQRSLHPPTAKSECQKSVAFNSAQELLHFSKSLESFHQLSCLGRKAGASRRFVEEVPWHLTSVPASGCNCLYRILASSLPLSNLTQYLSLAILRWSNMEQIPGFSAVQKWP